MNEIARSFNELDVPARVLVGMIAGMCVYALLQCLSLIWRATVAMNKVDPVMTKAGGWYPPSTKPEPPSPPAPPFNVSEFNKPLSPDWKAAAKALLDKQQPKPKKEHVMSSGIIFADDFEEPNEFEVDLRMIDHDGDLVVYDRKEQQPMIWFHGQEDWDRFKAEGDRVLAKHKASKAQAEKATIPDNQIERRS